MTQVANESSDKVAPQRSPGYLMAPFSWAAKPLAAMLEADCSLYQSPFTLSRQRMHLIAFALAHWPGEIDASFARLVIGACAGAAPVWTPWTPASARCRLCGDVRRYGSIRSCVGRIDGG
jgi:hypothetical protein